MGIRKTTHGGSKFIFNGYTYADKEEGERVDSMGLYESQEYELQGSGNDR